MMKRFSGFPPGKVQSTAIPEPFFTELLPLIDDICELKATLHVMWRLGQERAQVRFVRRSELLADQGLLASLADSHSIEGLLSGLQRAVDRGSLLTVKDPLGDREDVLYFANTPKGRAAVAAVERGEWPQEMATADRPNIFDLYEQTIGVLSPLIADELRDAEQIYKQEWIEDAFREAVALNKRNWRYVQAILERWLREGRDSEAGAKQAETDRRRYIEGKYGEYIQH
jgi:DnaD/phage-associated family protein